MTGVFDSAGFVVVVTCLGFRVMMIAPLSQSEISATPTLDRLRFEEREQVRVDLAFERRAQAVRRALVNLELRVLDQFGGKHGGSADRDDLIVVAVKDERWHVELLEAFGEICLREGLDAVEGGFVSSQHPLEPERIAQALRAFGAWPVGAVEGRAEILEKLRAIREDAGANLVERAHRQPAGIGGGLWDPRGHRADEDSLGDALGAVAAELSGHFAAPRGGTGMDCVLQVEGFGERRG